MSRPFFKKRELLGCMSSGKGSEYFKLLKPKISNKQLFTIRLISLIISGKSYPCTLTVGVNYLFSFQTLHPFIGISKIIGEEDF